MPVAKIIAALQLPPFRVGATRPMSWYEDFLFSNARIFVDAGISAIKVQDETREEGAAAIQTVARMAALGRAFRREFPGVSLGIIVQAHDAKAPLAIADACDADFVRMKVFVGAAVNAEGMRNALNVSAMQYRDLIGRTDIRIYADVHDRTCVPLAGMPHDTAAVWAQSLGADGIILTGANFADTLAALQMAFGDTWPGFAAELTGAMSGLRALPDQADVFAQSVVARLGGTCTGARFLGVGRSVATADYAAAKCVEVTKVPAWADDIEEFAHRQYWAMQTTELVVLLPTDRATAGYADATADALADLGVVTVALEPEGAAVPSAVLRLPLPGGAALAGITQAIAVQMLAYHLGLASGTNPNLRLHLRNHTARFAVSRKLTRRSLLGTGQ